MTEPAPEPAPARDPRTGGRLALLAATLVAAAWIVRLVLQSARGAWGADECFHAGVSAWILAHRALPVEFPDLYSGFLYYYHPLLHVLGAAWTWAAGPAALRFLPVAIAAAALAALLLGAARHVPAPARAWAALACVLSPLVGPYAVRLYAEGLTFLLFALAVPLIVAVARGARAPAAIALGAVVAAAQLAKFTGWALGAFLALAAVALAARGERERAARFALALAVAFGLTLPWLARNQVLYGSAFYPLGSNDVDPALLALDRARLGVTPVRYWLGIAGVVGVAPVALALAAIAAAVATRRRDIAVALLGFALVGILAVPLAPVAAPRHAVPFVPVLALAAAWIVHDALASRPRAAPLVTVALALAGTVAIATLRDLRVSADAPRFLRVGLAEVARRLPGDAVVLTPWTYETHYYTGRGATWPIAWGQRDRPLEPFLVRGAGPLRAAFERHHITHLLLARDVAVDAFDGRHATRSMVAGLDTLITRREAEVRWASDRMVLVRVGPP